MDIRVIVRRGVIYGISLILVLAIYTYLALALKSTIEQSWNINTTWTAIILIALVALGFPPLKRLVEKIVDTTFKGRQSIDLAVQEVRDAVAKKTDAQELADAVAKNIQGYLNANAVKIFLLERTKGCFVHSPDAMQREELHEDSSDLARLALVKPDVIIRDEIPHLIEEGKGNGNLQRAEHDMKKRHITAYVPLRTEDEVIGIIAVGDRTGSDAYTVQDVQYLEHVRDQVTAPLANALQYRDAMERIRLQMHGEASS
ncbi:MAG: GAF domain-containing protein [Patescibacteria group bacterium]|nr:GAF domain-containing protein [Patescibacteria group bacterium]MDD5715216.1 GAF domain-containing protein [Patescibacteria group bacterium]